MDSLSAGRLAPSSAGRLYALDLLRFLAAMSVVLCHYTFLGQFRGVAFSMPGVASVAKYGYLGVQLFFAISGCVIVMSIRSRNAWQFVVARIARLYPAYWICCTITVIVLNLAPSEPQKFSFAEWLGNMTMVPYVFGQPLVDGCYWTLMQEMKFYIFIFMLLALGWRKHLETSLWCWLALSAVTSCLGFETVVRAISARYAGYFVLGCAVYLVSATGWNRSRAALVGLSGGFGVFCAWDYTVQVSASLDNSQSPAIACAILAALILFFVLAVTLPLDIRWRHSATVGALTYPLYLVHQNVGYAAFNSWGSPHWRGIQLLIVTSAMLILAWLVVLAEGPTRSWLNASLKRIEASAARIYPLIFRLRPVGNGLLVIPKHQPPSIRTEKAQPTGPVTIVHPSLHAAQQPETDFRRAG